jgi:hypothetical protein
MIIKKSNQYPANIQRRRRLPRVNGLGPAFMRQALYRDPMIEKLWQKLRRGPHTLTRPVGKWLQDGQT